MENDKRTDRKSLALQKTELIVKKLTKNRLPVIIIILVIGYIFFSIGFVFGAGFLTALLCSELHTFIKGWVENSETHED